MILPQTYQRQASTMSYHHRNLQGCDALQQEQKRFLALFKKGEERKRVEFVLVFPPETKRKTFLFMLNERADLEGWKCVTCNQIWSLFWGFISSTSICNIVYVLFIKQINLNSDSKPL